MNNRNNNSNSNSPRKNSTIIKNDEQPEFIVYFTKRIEGKIHEYQNGAKTIDGIHIEQLYYAYLANNPEGKNIKDKNLITNLIYDYILETKLVVMGGKFSKPTWYMRFKCWCC